MDVQPSPRLVLEAGSEVQQAQEIALTGRDIVIGRDAQADLVIASPLVSRRHARLYSDDGHYLIEDLGSTNKTFLNGQPLDGPARLSPGDAIQIGTAIRLTFEAPVMDGVTEVADLAETVLEAALPELSGVVPLQSTAAERLPADQLPTEVIPSDGLPPAITPPALSGTQPAVPAASPAAGPAGSPPAVPAGTVPQAMPPAVTPPALSGTQPVGPAASPAAGAAGTVPRAMPPAGYAAPAGAVPLAGGSVPAQLPDRPAAPPRRRLLWVGAALLLLLVAAGVFLLARGDSEAPAGPGSGVVAASNDAPGLAVPAGDTATRPPATQPPAARPPASAATGALAGMANHMPGTASSSAKVTISDITLNEAQRYSVAFDLTEGITTTNLHFYFNTVRHDQAGAARPYAGASPFIGYTPADRPENAWQLCALVAGADGTAHAGSGNCALLPDVPLASAAEALACFFGPGEQYPAVGRLSAGEPALLRGLSVDELWWNVTNPQNPAGACWVSTLATEVSGDTGLLPIVEAPPPGAEPSLPSLAITSITIDAENRYVVDFEPSNFVPAYPGTHIHFFFNTFNADQVGIGGEANRLAHGGGPPFTGFAGDDRPESATQLCGLVANPDHTVLPNSGNCFDLPNLPSVRLTEIVTNTEQHYVADFEMAGFVPQYPGGMHLHFFFNTFSPDEVGIGGQANRRSHGSGPPFSGYAVADRPENATQLCVLVANPDHTMLPNSGNCLTLPGLPTAEITRITADAEQRYVVDFVSRGFVPQYPGGTHLHFYFNTFTADQVGIGGEANRRSHGGGPPFTGFTAADVPPKATQLCVVVANSDHSVIPNSGSCLALPDVLGAEITGITVDARNRYVVDYVAHGFTPKDPGTHIHFYFDTVSPEELSQSGVGHRYSHGGSSPFAAYSVADRPDGATQLCAVVINPDGSAVPNSGNCFKLPDVSTEP